VWGNIAFILFKITIDCLNLQPKTGTTPNLVEYTKTRVVVRAWAVLL